MGTKVSRRTLSRRERADPPLTAWSRRHGRGPFPVHHNDKRRALLGAVFGARTETRFTMKLMHSKEGHLICARKTRNPKLCSSFGVCMMLQCVFARIQLIFVSKIANAVHDPRGFPGQLGPLASGWMSMWSSAAGYPCSWTCMSQTYTPAHRATPNALAWHAWGLAASIRNEAGKTRLRQPK